MLKKLFFNLFLLSLLSIVWYGGTIYYIDTSAKEKLDKQEFVLSIKEDEPILYEKLLILTKENDLLEAKKYKNLILKEIELYQIKNYKLSTNL